MRGRATPSNVRSPQELGFPSDAASVVDVLEEPSQSRCAGRRRRTSYSAKAPSTPGAQHEGVLAAIAAVLGKVGAETRSTGAETREIRRFAHGMTVATNALLEGKGAKTALIATDGFTDIVELGRQARPSLYRLCEAGPKPLAPTDLRFGAPERMGPDGPLEPLDEEATAALLDRLADAEPGQRWRRGAVGTPYAHPAPRAADRRADRERLPHVHVSLSHELVGTFREYERSATTEVDAALSPCWLTSLSGAP